MEDKGYLTTSSGRKIPELKATAATFIDKTTTVYGPSKTGKTVIIKHIMKLLNGHIEQIIVVSPSEVSNRSYEGFVDAPFIHYKLSIPTANSKKGKSEKQEAIDFLSSIWERQEMMASIYTKVNNTEVLSRLFNMLPSRTKNEGISKIESLIKNKVDAIQKLNDLPDIDQGKKDEKIKDVDEKYEKMKTLILKKYITMEYDALYERDDLEEDELYALHYLNFNPRLLIIFDDCAAQIKPIANTDIFRKYFYQNRHSYISVILSCQDDTDLSPNLRKNAFVSFFTTADIFKVNFERSKVSKQQKAYIDEIAPIVFQGHQKAAYIREDDKKQNFYYVRFPLSKPFRFGSDAIHELCELVSNKGSTMDVSNSFYGKFKI